MSMEIKVNIIIPVYNAEKYIKRCVQSILNQKYDNWNILLVDDGSTDGSGEICNLLSENDERISAIHQDNAGVSAARNFGIDYYIKKKRLWLYCFS